MYKRSINIGDRYGRLTVQSHESIKNQSYYICRCDCGTTKPIQTTGLKSGKVKSCGCYKKQIEKLPRPWRRNPDRDEVRNRMLFAKARSNSRGGGSHSEKEFSLTIEQTTKLMLSPCYYCGDHKLSNSLRHRSTGEIYQYTGIDRIDPNKGYISGNVVSCCKTCNFMKRDLSLDDFLERIKTILSKMLTS
jgi:hypothetical protein